MFAYLFGFGIWFWSLIFVEFILLVWFVESDMEAASFVSIIVFLVLLWWLADVPIWQWIKNNPKRLLAYSVIYVVIGILWSMCKYYFSLVKTRSFLKEQKKEWKQNHEKYDGETVNFKEFVERKCRYEYKIRKTISFETSISNLVFWAMVWPPSMFWTLLDEPVRKLFTWLIKDVFIGAYRQLHKNMIENNLED